MQEEEEPTTIDSVRPNGVLQIWTDQHRPSIDVVVVVDTRVAVKRSNVSCSNDNVQRTRSKTNEWYSLFRMFYVRRFTSIAGGNDNIIDVRLCVRYDEK